MNQNDNDEAYCEYFINCYKKKSLTSLNMIEENKEIMENKNLVIYIEVLELQILCGRNRWFKDKRQFTKKMEVLKNDILLSTKNELWIRTFDTIKLQVKSMSFSMDKLTLLSHIKRIQSVNHSNPDLIIDVLMEQRYASLTTFASKGCSLSYLELTWLEKVEMILRLIKNISK